MVGDPYRGPAASVTAFSEKSRVTRAQSVNFRRTGCFAVNFAAARDGLDLGGSQAKDLQTETQFL